MGVFTSPVNIYIAVNVDWGGDRHGGSAAVLEYLGHTRDVLCSCAGLSSYDHILQICTQALEALKYPGLTVVIHTNNQAFITCFNNGSLRNRINGNHFFCTGEEDLRTRLIEAASGFDVSASYDAGGSEYSFRARRLAAEERYRSESGVGYS